MYELVKITDHYVFDKLSMSLFKVDTDNGKDVDNFSFCCRLEKKDDGNYVAKDRATEVAIGIIEKAKLLCEKLETV